MNRRWFAIAGGTAASLGLLAGLVTSPGQVASGAEPAPVEWQLPSGARLLRHDAANLAPVGLVPWKGVSGGQAGNEPEAAPVWFLRGIVGNPVPTALVADAQGKILRLRTGDLLPNGATLVRIEANRIVFETDGCPTSLDLHREPIPASGQAQPCASEDTSIPGNNP